MRRWYRLIAFVVGGGAQNLGYSELELDQFCEISMVGVNLGFVTLHLVLIKHHRAQ